jgi:hypothetical protein
MSLIHLNLFVSVDVCANARQICRTETANFTNYLTLNGKWLQKSETGTEGNVSLFRACPSKQAIGETKCGTGGGNQTKLPSLAYARN